MAEFARLLDVSAAAVSAWEKSRGALRLQMRTRAAVESAWTRGRRQARPSVASAGR
jgi:predicted transcriptional regulator